MFLREVDDALREDQLHGAVRRYGVPVGAALVLGLLAFGGWLWWESHQDSQAAERGETFVLALDNVEGGRLDPGRSGLAPLAKDGGEGYSAAARMMQGGIALEKGSRDEAAKLFASVAADKNTPEAFRNLATIREVAVRFDALPPATVVERLKPLATPGAPWFASAGELVGIAYMKQGRNDLAGPLFAAIAKDEAAPDTLRQRARQIAGLLGVDAVEEPRAAAKLVQPATGAGATAQ